MRLLQVLDEVERRRALSPALVQPFMRAIMEAQFPAPGRTIAIKTFLPGSGTEVSDAGGEGANIDADVRIMKLIRSFPGDGAVSAL